MTQPIYRPDTARMWILLMVAAVYLWWIFYLPDISGGTLFDGSIGVVLGLYICSHPAANGIDLLFLQRGAFRRVVKESSGVAWLLLNAMVMFVGWVVIVIGASRFMMPVV
jgi:hypothetical protein